MLKFYLLPALFLMSFSVNANQTFIDDLDDEKVESHYSHISSDDEIPSISITNTENHFVAIAPFFNITCNTPLEFIEWQISSSPDFPWSATIGEACLAKDCISLTASEEAFLDNQTIYYFRAKGISNAHLGDWSEPFTFVVNHSQTTENLSIDQNQHFRKSLSLDIQTGYERNPFVSEEVWEALTPYFLPENSSQKAALDKIFSKRRVLSSRKSMVKSGFTLLTHSDDKIIVARHPYLKGFLIKAYSDEMGAPDWFWWKKRIDGVRAIEQKIVQCGYQGFMKTPKKWIYPLPVTPAPKNDAPYRKNFILVVEEMDILDRKHNLKAYRTKMTTQILDAFYIMLTDLLLLDSVYADNVPFCKDGKLAFVDTEHSLDTTRPVPITTVAKYLSPAMYAYWEQLVVHGGPPR